MWKALGYCFRINFNCDEIFPAIYLLRGLMVTVDGQQDYSQRFAFSSIYSAFWTLFLFIYIFFLTFWHWALALLLDPHCQIVCCLGIHVPGAFISISVTYNPLLSEWHCWRGVASKTGGTESTGSTMWLGLRPWSSRFHLWRLSQASGPRWSDDASTTLILALAFFQ